MTNIKAGVVLVTRYTTPHSSVYESYIWQETAQPDNVTQANSCCLHYLMI